MAELVIALAPLVLLAAFTACAMLLPVSVIAGTAIGLVAIGFLIGVPSGLVYHVLLRRELARTGSVPRGWYWKPQEHHASIPEPRAKSLLRWFWVGAVSCLVIIVGLALSVAALFLWFRAQHGVPA